MRDSLCAASMNFHLPQSRSAWWGKSFVKELSRISGQAEKKAKKPPPPTPNGHGIDAWDAADGFDGSNDLNKALIEHQEWTEKGSQLSGQ